MRRNNLLPIVLAAEIRKSKVAVSELSRVSEACQSVSNKVRGGEGKRKRRWRLRGVEGSAVFRE